MPSFLKYILAAVLIASDPVAGFSFQKPSGQQELKTSAMNLQKAGISSMLAAAVFFNAADPAAATVVGKGEKIFNANCAQCHAAGKQMDVKAMSLQKDDLLNGPGLDQQAVENYLKEEFPHKYMPFKLKPQGYTQVVSYVLDNAVKDKWGE